MGAVEPEVVGNVLDDLVQARRDDVRRLTGCPVTLEQLERLGEEQRPQDGLHRLTEDLLEGGDGQSLQQTHPVDRRSPRPVDSGEQEQELPQGRPGEIACRQQAAPPERARERERGRSADQGAVEIEERRGHPLLGWNGLVRGHHLLQHVGLLRTQSRHSANRRSRLGTASGMFAICKQYVRAV